MIKDDGFTSYDQAEVSDIILAKAAVRAAIEVLLHKCMIISDDVSNVYISGGFGYFLDIKKAVDIGLFPRGFFGKTISCGNTSLRGAIDILCDGRLKDTASEIAGRCNEIVLANDREFDRLFIENMKIG